jgi:hypothetical protein
MPSFTTLVLTDRAATPVAHTLVPRDRENGIATVVESTGVPVGETAFSIAPRRSQQRVKTRIVLRIPVVQTETINGIATPKVVREAIVDATFNFAVTSSEQERKNAVGMFQSALDPSKLLVNDTIVKCEHIYG